MLTRDSFIKVRICGILLCLWQLVAWKIVRKGFFSVTNALHQNIIEESSIYDYHLWFTLTISKFLIDVAWGHSFSTCTKFSEKLAYQGVRNVSFSGSFAYVLNEWPPSAILSKYFGKYFKMKQVTQYRKILISVFAHFLSASVKN